MPGVAELEPSARTGGTEASVDVEADGCGMSGGRIDGREERSKLSSNGAVITLTDGRYVGDGVMVVVVEPASSFVLLPGGTHALAATRTQKSFMVAI